MPNGGEHHCAHCRHFILADRKCELRKINITGIAWTTCRDWNRDSDVPHGPVFSIVCEVKDGAGSYGDIPWYKGNSADTYQETPGSDTMVIVRDRTGNLYEFDDINAYLKFWRENTPKEEQ